MGQGTSTAPSSTDQSGAQPSSTNSQGDTSSAQPSGKSATPADQNGSVSGAATDQNGNAATPANDNNGQAATSNADGKPVPMNSDTRAAESRSGGLPWTWIILGALALIVIIGLMSRGDRTVVKKTERVERIDRSDDDIRRVG